MKVVVGGLTLSLLLVACEKPPPTQKDRASAIALKASTTGSFLSDAVEVCRIAGFNDIVDCSNNKRELPEEKSAARAASFAIKQRISFEQSCYPGFGTDYCDDLLQRAYAIARRTPRDIEAERPEPPDGTHVELAR